jgi:hypothetical protein
MARVHTGSEKNVKYGAKKATVELWRAKVLLSNIRSQLKLSKSTLRRILAFFAKRNPINPIIHSMSGSGRPKKISEETRRLIKKKLKVNPSLTAVRHIKIQNINFLNLLCHFFPHICVRPVRFIRVYC